MIHALLREPWRGLDDQALLGHFQTRRGVRYAPMIDAEECNPERIDGILAGRFTFVGRTHELRDPIDWLTNPSHDVEWHILLHKFYYAVGLTQRWQQRGDEAALERWQQLIDGWIDSVPAGFIAADVTGRRVQNWIYSLHGVVLDAPRRAPIDPAFWRKLLASLHEQVEFLCANLTPKRNHRTLELLAIFLAGVVFPEFTRAAAWREFALEHTRANVQADLLPDGVHCELSTDYHHLALRNWLLVRTLAADNGFPVPDELDRGLEAALDFGLHVHQPSGSMPSLSDGDIRGFLPLVMQGARLFGRDDMRYVASLGREGAPPRQRVAHFPSSGYHVIRSDWDSGDAQHLVFDCGPVGEGNHGHFDALSFELAAHGQALIVDPGRYTYSEAPDPADPADPSRNWRLHFRGTAAHNTVCVDGLNQTRYEPRPVKDASRHVPGSVRHKIVGPAPDTAMLEARHGGFLDLLHGRCSSHAYAVTHDRCLVFVDRTYWIVTDWLEPTALGEGGVEHDFVLRFQLGAQAFGRADLVVQDGCARLTSPGLVAAQPARATHRFALARGWVSPRYGHKDEAPALTACTRARRAAFDTVLLPCVGDAPLVVASDIDITAADGRRATAVRITIDRRADAARQGLSTDGWFHDHGAHGRSWRIEDWTFTGRWLHWRCDAQGRLVRALSHAGAVLVGPEGPLEVTHA